MMKHIREGFDRICRTPVPQDDGYMTDAEWRKLPECPVCFGKHTTDCKTGAIPATICEATKMIYDVIEMKGECKYCKKECKLQIHYRMLAWCYECEKTFRTRLG
jgi:hypothetical protein